MPPDPDVFLVIWNGEMLELEAPDAIAFSEVDAWALVAASPGRRESYSVDRRALRTLLSSPVFSPLADALRARIAAGDTTPFMLRDEAERRRRARSRPGPA
jgi:hypothetical protein